MMMISRVFWYRGLLVGGEEGGSVSSVKRGT